MKGIDWWNAYQTERQAQEIFFQQEQDGWYFDLDTAHKHVDFLESESERLYNLIAPNLDLDLVKPFPKHLTRITLKNGEYTDSVKKWFADHPAFSDYVYDSDLVGGPFTRIRFDPPNLRSDEQLKKHLFRMGWKPTQWNYKKSDGTLDYDENGDPIVTSPKLTEDSYDSLTIGIGPDLKYYLIYQHRLSQLKGILENVRPDQTIPSVVDNPGTPTARVRHRIVTNIPRVSSIFGRELRECFTARPGRILVGEDRSQIEARLIAHVSVVILGDYRLADVILGRDFHQVIYEALEGLCTSRQAAKTPEYAFFFGAKEKKLGQSIDNKPKEWSYEKAGTEVIKLMQKNIPGIVEVREALAEAAKRGWIKGFDGRKFFIRKAHAALNTYTQGNAQVCCKLAMIKQQKEAKAKKLDVIQTGYYHDETQNDCDPNDAELFGNIAVQSIRTVGEELKLHVPLDGEFKLGKNWAETH